MGYQADIDAMPHGCRRPLSFEQLHGERRFSGPHSWKIAYLALFGVDFKYTYALEMRLHEAASVDFSQHFVSTVPFESPPCYIFKSS